ncbi:DUF6444 domain-containing protein [Microtetraspora malaysiensis]|uniref:DUF6444 domain-containing protein n=1 Tax=Microtetraspora malaysiensis TaxID=161358 RepID=UPI003D8BD806
MLVSDVAQLRAELAELRAGLAEAHEMIRDLQRVIVAKDEQITRLSAESAWPTEENTQLRGRVAELERQLKMNSTNSSLPPSSDQMTRSRPKSLRQKTGRKPGKAAGEGGAVLAVIGRCDVVEHRVGHGDGAGRAAGAGSRPGTPTSPTSPTPNCGGSTPAPADNYIRPGHGHGELRVACASPGLQVK